MLREFLLHKREREHGRCVFAAQSIFRAGRAPGFVLQKLMLAWFCGVGTLVRSV